LAFQLGKEVEDLQAGEVGIEAKLARQISDFGPGGQTLRETVMAENRSLSAGGSEEIQQQANGGRLARAIQTEETEDLTLSDFEIEIMECGERSVSFREATNRNGGCLGAAHRLG